MRASLQRYMVGELGLSPSACEQRVRTELERTIPRRVYDALESNSGWSLGGARLLDVGAGQGGAVLEALERGADAWGLEPGEGFGWVARRRLEAAGRRPGRITCGIGEALPFGTGTFDYVVTLQVLEHARDPEAVIREIARVLESGGRCFMACENYLSFREPHYRVPWFPLLPRRIGAAYLRLLGRKPDFLLGHVTYVTYPEIWAASRRAGLIDLDMARYVAKARAPDEISTPWLRAAVRIARAAGLPTERPARLAVHARRMFSRGVYLNLRKGHA